MVVEQVEEDRKKEGRKRGKGGSVQNEDEVGIKMNMENVNTITHGA